MTPTQPATLARRIAAQTRSEARTMMRNGEQLLLLIVLPVLALFALRSLDILDPLLPAGASRVDMAVPGLLALCVISNAFSGQAIQTGFDRRYGVMRHMATTPLGRSGLIAGKLGAILIVLAVQVVLIGGLGLLLGWDPKWAAVPAALVVLVLGAVAFTGLGMLVAGTLRAEATLAVVNLLWVLLAALGGTMAPTCALPGWLAPVVHLLPSAALGSALRALLVPMDQFSVLASVLLLLAWSAVGWWCAMRWFRWN